MAREDGAGAVRTLPAARSEEGPIDPAAVARQAADAALERAVEADVHILYGVETEDLLAYRGMREQELGPEEMCLAMDGWTPAHVDRLEDALRRLEREAVERKETPDHYVDYVVRKKGVMRKAMSIYDNSRNDMARVAALNLASSAADQIVKTGQDLGLIDRAAKRVVVAGGLTLTDMSRDQLERTVDQMIEQRQRLKQGRPAAMMLEDD